MPVSKDPHCKCGKAIAGTVKDDICHGWHHCTALGDVPDDWKQNSEAYREFLRIFGESL